MSAEMNLTPATAGTHAARLAASHYAGRLWKETDTGLIYRDDGAAWSIWKGDGHVRKTADETVNNSSTLQNDDHLFFPVEANEVWRIELEVILSLVTATPKWLANLYGPAGASASLWAASNDGGAANAALALGANMNFAAAIAGISAARVRGVFVNGATAGTFGLKWAQNTPTAENTKVLANSTLKMRRLA